MMTALCSGALCLYQTGSLPGYLWLIQALSTKNVKRKTIFVFREFLQLGEFKPLPEWLYPPSADLFSPGRAELTCYCVNRRGGVHVRAHLL